MKKSLITLSVLGLLLCSGAGTAFAARLFPGYAGCRWGTNINWVTRVFRNGSLGKIGEQFIYKQLSPNGTISVRTFGFRSTGLNAVSITFDGDYVRRIGAENLLSRYIRFFGEGTADRSSAPHMISFSWEDPFTRVTFAYSPTRPEMAVLMFQQKENN